MCGHCWVYFKISVSSTNYTLWAIDLQRFIDIKYKTFSVSYYWKTTQKQHLLNFRNSDTKNWFFGRLNYQNILIQMHICFIHITPAEFHLLSKKTKLKCLWKLWVDCFAPLAFSFIIPISTVSIFISHNWKPRSVRMDYQLTRIRKFSYIQVKVRHSKFNIKKFV